MVKSMVLRELHTLEETTMDKVRFLMSDTGAPFTAACREALEQKGVDVTVVEKDGNKVLQKMLTVRPQVVLLDAFMPGLDALAVKQRYNAAGERHTSFFVTGAFQSEEMVQELLDEGFAYSGDDCYKVYTFDKSVYKNKDVIYKGYVPSTSVSKHGSSSASSKTDEIPQESKNALSRAERYYHDMDLSKSQVRKQLEYEGYEKDAIDYAMKNLT